MITDDKLLEYNNEGLIPSPGENEYEFVERADKAYKIKERLYSKESSPLKTLFKKDSEIPPTPIDFDKVYSTTTALYGIKPKWVPIFFDDYKLAYWHGGSAWIFQEHIDSPKEAFLQIRREPSLFYKREEIIAHEMAHIGRMAFDEPRFEEILAYRTSEKKWRQWLGPIIQTGWESASFIGILFIIIALDVALLSTGMYEFMQIAVWLKLIPIAMIFYFLGRLIWLHTTFNRSLKNLQIVLKDTMAANAVIYRLTDFEICLFAKMPTSAIEKYMNDSGNLYLRWRLINLAYRKNQNLKEL